MTPLKGFRDEKAKSKEPIQNVRRVIGKDSAAVAETSRHVSFRRRKFAKKIPLFPRLVTLHSRFVNFPDHLKIGWKNSINRSSYIRFIQISSTRTFVWLRNTENIHWDFIGDFSRDLGRE
jgi:hypothetical protein